MTEQCKARMPSCECSKVKQESAFIYKKEFLLSGCRCYVFGEGYK